MHSTFSDGALGPVDLVAAISRARIECMSLTDHDTISGIQEARAACVKAGLLFVPGVEISTLVDGSEVHLLGYGYDPEKPALLEFLDEQRRRRRTRIVEFHDRLVRAGVPISDIEYGDEQGTVGRPHLANAIIAAGGADSIQDAFQTYLVEGTATFVPRDLPTAGAAIHIIHDSGGIISLAHPGDFISNQTVLSLIESGLDAIEVTHPAHDERLVNYYTDIAARYDLYRTGGSDFHGWSSDDEESLGQFIMDWELPPNILS